MGQQTTKFYIRIRHSDVNKDLGPKAKAKDLVSEDSDPHQA